MKKQNQIQNSKIELPGWIEPHNDVEFSAVKTSAKFPFSYLRFSGNKYGSFSVQLPGWFTIDEAYSLEAIVADALGYELELAEDEGVEIVRIHVSEYLISGAFKIVKF